MNYINLCAIYMKTALLACSFAGMDYVPIDIGMPEKRINEIIKIMNREQYNKIKKIYLNLDDIYYIIFTSGSTGKPKGVKVTYENVNSCIEWLKDITKIEKGIGLNQAIFSFDLSVADLYLSILLQL